VQEVNRTFLARDSQESRRRSRRNLAEACASRTHQRCRQDTSRRFWRSHRGFWGWL